MTLYNHSLHFLHQILIGQHNINTSVKYFWVIAVWSQLRCRVSLHNDGECTQLRFLTKSPPSSSKWPPLKFPIVHCRWHSLTKILSLSFVKFSQIYEANSELSHVYKHVCNQKQFGWLAFNLENCNHDHANFRVFTLDGKWGIVVSKVHSNKIKNNRKLKRIIIWHV